MRPVWLLPPPLPARPAQAVVCMIFVTVCMSVQKRRGGQQRAARRAPFPGGATRVTGLAWGQPAAPCLLLTRHVCLSSSTVPPKLSPPEVGTSWPHGAAFQVGGRGGQVSPAQPLSVQHCQGGSCPADGRARLPAPPSHIPAAQWVPGSLEETGETASTPKKLGSGAQGEPLAAWAHTPPRQAHRALKPLCCMFRTVVLGTPSLWPATSFCPCCPPSNVPRGCQVSGMQYLAAIISGLPHQCAPLSSREHACGCMQRGPRGPTFPPALLLPVTVTSVRAAFLKATSLPPPPLTKGLGTTSCPFCDIFM